MAEARYVARCLPASIAMPPPNSVASDQWIEFGKAPKAQRRADGTMTRYQNLPRDMEQNNSLLGMHARCSTTPAAITSIERGEDIAFLPVFPLPSGGATTALFRRAHAQEAHHFTSPLQLGAESVCAISRPSPPSGRPARNTVKEAAPPPHTRATPITH